MKKEAQARIKINHLLKKAGWRFFDDPKDAGKPANIQLEPQAKTTSKELSNQGDDFEKTKHGFVDYLLLDEQGFSSFGVGG